MGRYYSGDINGKFWVGLQSSNAADRFGVKGHEPSYIEYYFDDYDLQSVEDEIKNIEQILGNKIIIIEKFFEENNGYNDKMLEKAGISLDELRNYADLGLGNEIKKCIESNGSCSFTAEL